MFLPVPGDQYYESVVLLLPMNGENSSTTFTDYSASPKTVTAYGDAQISTAQSKFGGSSGYFDGSGDYLTTPSNVAFDFGANDLTVECWFRTAQTTAYVVLVGRDWGGDSTGGWTLMLNNGTSGPLAVWMADYTTSNPLLAASVNTHRDNEWHHLAWTRSGSAHKLFLDGAQVAAVTTTANFSSVNKQIQIGADLTYSGRDYNGYLQDVRITKGIARYTADFTPPSSPASFIAPSLSPIPIVRQDGPDQSTKIARIGL